MKKTFAIIILTIASYLFFQGQVIHKEVKILFDKDQPFEIINSQRGITTQSSASDTNMCKGWTIVQADLPGIIKDSKAIDGHEWHYLFDNLPCVVNGQLKQKGHDFKFEINAGSWMLIFCSDTTLLLGNFKKQDEKYFLSKPWNEKK
ncbi:MAG TPA: hypothetical protein VE978_07535 [Chitinophagales bacterium]|nr:hypothetical protein [Chitinophagales bacterium]